MLIISWNVAGWSSTVRTIRDSYGSLEEFFRLTGADILCIQECKGTRAKLSRAPLEIGASDPPPGKRLRVEPVFSPAARDDQSNGTGVSCPTNPGIAGWESFWSFSGKGFKGFNGVATFARQGLTWRCNARPFADEDLNEEGRTIVTHHSAFVLVNVYVPNARGGERSAFKGRYLEALQNLMEDLRRSTAKPIMLVGDLNMTYRAEDAAWQLRRIHIGDLIELNRKQKEHLSTRGIKELKVSAASLGKLSNAVANLLCQRVLESCPALHIGKDPEESPSSPFASSVNANRGTQWTRSLPVSTSVVSVDTPPTVDDDTASPVQQELVKELRACIKVAWAGMDARSSKASLDAKPPVSLERLYEAGLRTVHVEDLATSSVVSCQEVFTVTQYCHLPPHGDESIQFMGRLLQNDLRTSSGIVKVDHNSRKETRMWDTFLLSAEAIQDPWSVAASPSQAYCPCPYTCWDQSRNKRSANVGTRLDYIFVDEDLLKFVIPRSETANNVGFNTTPNSSPFARPPPADRRHCDDTEEFYSQFSGRQRSDGICRAMAGGAYPIAPFDGSGLPQLEGHARGHMFRGLPSTGLLVTPPQLSDHIGVCLWLDDRLVLLPRPGKIVEDNPCMYRPPVGLPIFFSLAATKAPNAAEPPVKVAREEPSAADSPSNEVAREVIEIDDSE